MAKQPNLSKLSEKELVDLSKAVDKARASMATKKKQEALDAAKAEAKKRGFNLQDLVGKPKANSKPAQPPKYRHPENPEVTWSGRGRRPDWIKEALSSGHSLDEFAI